eukprot:356058-Chlamydomonas_euryale.AAC.10
MHVWEVWEVEHAAMSVMRICREFEHCAAKYRTPPLSVGPFASACGAVALTLQLVRLCSLGRAAALLAQAGSAPSCSTPPTRQPTAPPIGTHRRRAAGVERLLPPRRAEAPLVAGLEAGEAAPRRRRHEVVAARRAELEEFTRYLCSAGKCGRNMCGFDPPPAPAP